MPSLATRTPTDPTTALTEARDLIATADNRMSQLHEAERRLRALQAASPQDSEVNHTLALALVYQGRSQESIPFHRRAVSLAPNTVGYLYSFLDALVFNNHYEEAHEAIQSWAAHTPKDAAITEFEETIAGVLRSRRPRAMIHWPQRVEALRDTAQILESDLFHFDTPPGFQFPPASKVLTLGSCFAENIARVLNRHGADAFNITLGEAINSTYANLHYLRRVRGEDIGPVGAVIAERLGRDPIEDRSRFQEAALVVLTLGVAPCFFRRDTGAFMMFREREFAFRQLGDVYEWRNTTVAENTRNLTEIVALLHGLNPRLRIIVSVSPVPLVCTFDYPSAIVADCVSKATLRAAVDEALRGLGPGVLYWPSFEAFRWVGAYRGDAFGADDGCSCHASEHVLDAVFAIFMRKFFSGSA